MSRGQYLTPVAREELVRALTIFTLPPLVWDVFAGLDESIVEEPVDEDSWYNRAHVEFPKYVKDFQSGVDYEAVYGSLFTTIRNAKSLRLEAIDAKQITEELNRSNLIVSLVFPLSLSIEVSPGGNVLVHPDIVIRRLTNVFGVAISSRSSLLGPIPNFMNKTSLLNLGRQKPEDAGLIAELQEIMPEGTLYTVTFGGINIFLESAHKAGYLRQLASEVIVDTKESDGSITPDVLNRLESYVV